VYAAAHDLPAGASLKDRDLMVVRVRLPAASLRHYLQPGPDRRVAGRVLTAPVRRDALVPAGLVLASSRDAGLVELPLQVEPGDMAQGLRPGDTVQVLAAYTDGARRGRAAVLLPTAEVVKGMACSATSDARHCAVLASEVSARPLAQGAASPTALACRCRRCTSGKSGRGYASASATPLKGR
jgi:hypothetical protein